MPVQLPYDVWFIISKLLPSDELKRLYPVNKALYHISMDVRYQAAFIGSPLLKDTTRSLTRLIQPNLAARVRTLTLQPGCVCQFVENEQTRKSQSTLESKATSIKLSLLRHTTSILPRGKRMFKPTTVRLTAKQVMANLDTIMTGLTALKVLNIVILPDHHLPFFRVDLPFLNCTRGPFAINLQELDLKVSVEDLPKMLSLPSASNTSRPGPVILPNLEILSLTLHLIDKHSVEDPLITGPLASFINGCGRNIHTLSINTGMGLNPSTGLLKHISKNGPIFTSLSTLKIRQFYQTSVTDFAGLYSFLQAHKPSIRHLQLHLTVEVAVNIPSGALFFSHPVFTQLSLPLLEHIEMGLYWFPNDYLPNMIPFLTRFRHLRILSIESGYVRWSFENFEALLQGLRTPSLPSSLPPNMAPPKSLRGLINLELTLETFRARILGLLCQFLHRLEVLRLDFSGLAPIGYGDLHGVRVPMFCCELESIDLTNWTLRTLHLRPLHLINSNRQACKAALVKALPGVESFCGRSPEDYANTSDFI